MGRKRRAVRVHADDPLRPGRKPSRPTGPPTVPLPRARATSISRDVNPALNSAGAEVAHGRSTDARDGLPRHDARMHAARHKRRTGECRQDRCLLGHSHWWRAISPVRIAARAQLLSPCVTPLPRGGVVAGSPGGLLPSGPRWHVSEHTRRCVSRQLCESGAESPIHNNITHYTITNKYE